MIASSMLAVAGIYFVVWLQRRESHDYLMFVLLAISTAGIAGTELWMMHATSISEFGTALRWFHVPVATAIFACIALIYYRLRPKRLWLAWTAVALRVATLIINFIQDPNINYSEITLLERTLIAGDTISMVEGISNPAMLVANISLLFLSIFVVDAAVTAWRRDRDRFTLALGATLVVLVIGGSIQAILIFWEFIQLPVFITPFFLGLTIVMGIEVSLSVLSSIKLEQQSARQKTQLAQLSKAATLSELSASLAHEINQPLGVILSNAEAAEKLLQRDSPDIAEIRDIVADIIAADKRAADVITRLRALLHQEEPDFQALMLNDIVDEAIHLSREELKSQQVNLQFDLANGLPTVKADRTLLVQAILNLVSNAIDAVAENSVQERRIVVATAASGQTVEATISDNGKGLPADPEQLFDPFFTTKATGLGMGLAIAQSIATAHDGRIWADSGKVGNTTFHLSLPSIPAPA
jgi:signal transduction histidine kinase